MRAPRATQDWSIGNNKFEITNMEKWGPGTDVSEFRISKNDCIIMGWYRFGLLATLLVNPSSIRNQIRKTPVSSIATMELAVLRVAGCLVLLFDSDSGLFVVLDPQDQLSSHTLTKSVLKIKVIYYLQQFN